MKKNIGNIDRIIRVLIAVAVIILYFTNVISGIIAIILLILSGIFILTAFISICPIYMALGIKTIKQKR